MTSVKNSPFFSVCVPAYNRVQQLGELLDSVFSQDCQNFEIVICEDNSKERNEIRKLIQNYQTRYPEKIQYFENAENLGYDGNFRELIRRSAGQYCFFLGNDDLMAPQALSKLESKLRGQNNIGFVLRAYASFQDDPKLIEQEFKYFPEARVFEPGPDSIVTCFRRAVVISGLVFHRESAVNFATTQFDGTLLYQQHLVAEILKSKQALYLPDILAYYRNGGTPEFGNSQKEAGLFVPGLQTPDSSVHFMRGMLAIAKAKDILFPGKIYSAILQDLANYSYPFIAIQSKQRKLVFFKYYWQLAKLGFGRYLMFHTYFWSLLFLGETRLGNLIKWIKRKLGYTPVLGNVYQGAKTK